ncbi:MAG: fasciclin domain-containing protein [Spirosomataceae bacterium]
MKNRINTLLMSVICLCFFSCEDMVIQKKFVFEPGIPELATFKDKTAWDFIQTQTSHAGTTPASGKLDYMITLIKVAGLEEEYSKDVSKRTYLFLTNAAFTGAGRINALLTGVTAGTGDLTKVDKTRAANLLKYHIIDAYVDQSQALPIYFVNYEFKTLLDGPNGIIKIQRNERLSITINNDTSLPSTRRTTNVTQHNYVLKNGIAHFIASHVGIAAF